MTEQRVKNRGWVKNVAIIFLAVMLVLTFFSNTIMNASLPEAAVQYVQSGSITTQIRGTGTITAKEVYEVKTTTSRKVQSVLVTKDQEVKVGDVLRILPGDRIPLDGVILTGESRAYSDVKYIGEAVKIARKYFRNIGIEIYPVNVDEYQYLHECGVDYVTVFQETYNTDKYETLHLMGHKRVWPYRFDAQERALMGGMRGAGFSALLGLDDFRKDALATALHVYYINRKYPHAELSLSCPRLRPIVNNDKINPRDVGEKELCQVLCAYRIFLPFAGITVSSRESAAFRDGITKICATKVSAGVSTGIGDHEEKYEGKEDSDVGDEQFEINDGRSFEKMYHDMEEGGLQPVLNDYIYV